MDFAGSTDTRSRFNTRFLNLKINYIPIYMFHYRSRSGFKHIVKKLEDYLFSTKSYKLT